MQNQNVSQQAASKALSSGALFLVAFLALQAPAGAQVFASVEGGFDTGSGVIGGGITASPGGLGGSFAGAVDTGSGIVSGGISAGQGGVSAVVGGAFDTGAGFVAGGIVVGDPLLDGGYYSPVYVAAPAAYGGYGPLTGAGAVYGNANLPDTGTCTVNVNTTLDMGY